MPRAGLILDLYPDNIPLRDKIELIAREIMVGDYSPAALSQPIILKPWDTKLYLSAWPDSVFPSDDPKIGRPRDYRITVREIRLSKGLGCCPITGDILTMPGLPKRPAACNMDIDADGKITRAILKHYQIYRLWVCRFNRENVRSLQPRYCEWMKSTGPLGKSLGRGEEDEP